MDQRYRLKCIVVTGAIACLTTGLTAHAQSLPAGSGKADFQRICSGCHTLDRATSQRMNRTEWAAVVNDMVARGAQGSSAELDNVVSYLSANFGKSNTASPAAPGRAASVPEGTVEEEDPLSQEEIAKA